MDIFEPMVDAYAANVAGPDNQDDDPDAQKRENHPDEDPYEEEEEEHEHGEDTPDHGLLDDQQSQSTRFSYGHDQVKATAAQLQLTGNKASLTPETNYTPGADTLWVAARCFFHLLICGAGGCWTSP